MGAESAAVYLTRVHIMAGPCGTPLKGSLRSQSSAVMSSLLRQRCVALAMLLGLPTLAWYLWVCLTFYGGAFVSPDRRLLTHLPAPTLTAATLYLAWWSLQLLLHAGLPAHLRRGTPVAGGSPLTYRLNGWLSFWLTWAVLLAVLLLGVVSPGVAYDEFGPLMATANIVAFALAGYVYRLGARSPDRVRSAAGLYAYVMGRSLNPRVGDLDLKFFCESRPALLLWVVINASLAAKQYELHGSVTTPMLLVNAFQLLYVADFFFHEEALLTTWDIKHERFGWMLCWGCLVWVPFTFSIQAYYLVTHVHELTAVAIAALVTLNMTGYVIFRSVNLQKHRFRRDPARHVWGQPPAFIRTASGVLLLTSGWWGVARHLNYLGDLLMGLAWCLPTGIEHPLPYFYFVYFFILLIHRERRDHAMCLQKYGEAWEAYCRKVRWRIVPGLY
jgi:Delta14-sterol reductase